MRTSTPGSSFRVLDPRGFTLVEVMVVLVLAAAALGIVAPSLSRGMSGLELEASARDLITRMKQARSQAISRQQVFRIILVREDAESSGEPVDSYLLADAFEQPIRQFSLPAGIVVEKNDEEFPVRVSFYPNGRSSGGWIVLRTERRQIGVWVDPITGFAKAFKDPDEVRRFEREYS